jgi:hypothetical protein
MEIVPSTTIAHSRASILTEVKNSNEYISLYKRLKSIDQPEQQTNEIKKVINNYINGNSNSDNSSDSSIKDSKEVSKVKGLMISQKAIDEHLHKVIDLKERKMLEDLKKQVKEKLAESLKNLKDKEDSKEIEEQLQKEINEEVARSSLNDHNKAMQVKAIGR